MMLLIHFYQNSKFLSIHVVLVIIYQKETRMLNYIQTQFSLHINIFNRFLLPNSYWFLLFKQ